MQERQWAGEAASSARDVHMEEANTRKRGRVDEKEEDTRRGVER